MPSLRDLQLRCIDAFVLDDATMLLDAVVAGRVPAAARIEVYRNNFRELHRKALVATYPVIERLVGEECFAGLARAYTLRYPPVSGDLQRFGGQFAALLDEQYGGTEFDYLADVACLERAIDEALLLPRETKLDPRVVEGFSADQLAALTFIPSLAVTLQRSRYPIVTIWRANQPGCDGRADLGRGAEHVVVCREHDAVLVRCIGADTFELATALRAGQTLEQASESLLEGDGGRLAQALREVIASGCLSGVAAVTGADGDGL